MPGVVLEIECYNLDANSNPKLVKQNTMRMNPNYQVHMKAKVDRLLSVNLKLEAK